MKKGNGFEAPGLEPRTIEELSAELMKANAELRQLQKEREFMFANISHDLRAPMTAIRSALDLALSREDPGKQELLDALRLIDRRAKTLEALVRDMYFLYRVDSSAVEYTKEKLDAASFLKEFYYDLLADASFEPFKLSMDIDCGPDCMILVDVQKIVRVLSNLFVNAAKYAGKGSEITLKAGLDAERKGFIKVSVVDNGKGIPEDRLPFIFLRTYTVSDARTPMDTETGSGLGLAIAKSIIEKHGGTIECTSRVGEGTAVSFYLPVCS